MKAQSLTDTGDPELRAGGREDEDVSGLFVFGNFIENFRVREFWEPVGEETFYVGVEFFPAHAPEVAMKDTLHPARAEDFVEREKGDKNEGEEASHRFLSENIAPKNELGIPGDDRLVEIEEDVFSRHCWKAKRLGVNWNFKFGQSEGRLFPVRAVLFALGVIATPLHAQLYADVTTTMGDFTLELYYEESPKTVANFVSLAEGSRKWIDPVTGIVQVNKPYFDGIIFHRVIDAFMNQVGSPQGTGSDGPGYTFPDEVDNGLVHDEPYLLSSANSGPNTNGSQLFITVVVTNWLDGIHTVFGKVSSGTDVIDAINDVDVGKIFNGNFDSTRPVVDVSITSVVIRRVGPEANAFDVTAQGLPEVEQAEVGIENPESGLNLTVNQAAGTSLKVFQSPDMVTWSSQSRHLDSGSLPSSGIGLPVNQSQEFFRSVIIDWPTEASFPSDLTGWSIAIESPLNGLDLTLNFSDEPTLFLEGNGTFLINMESSSIDTDGYGGTLLIYTDGLVPFRFRLGSDLPINSSAPSGRMTGTAFTGGGITLSGGFTMTPLP